MNLHHHFPVKPYLDRATDDILVRSSVGLSPLPNEILPGILEHLTEIDLARCSQIGTYWNKIVNQIPVKNVNVFDGEIWKKIYKFVIDGEVPEIPIGLKKMVRCLDNKVTKNEAYHPSCSLILIPKGLTFNKIKDLLQSSHAQHFGFQFSEHCESLLLQEFGDVSIDRSYWALMTNEVVEGTQNLEYANQLYLIQKELGPHYNVPNLLEGTVNTLMNHAGLGVFPYGPESSNTHLEETFNEWNLVLGFTDSFELLIDYADDYDGDIIGAAACRRFS